MHPQAVMHGLVCYHDGSVLAQLGAARHAHPDRARASPGRGGSRPTVRALDLAALVRLEFFAPDPAGSRRCGWRARPCAPAAARPPSSMRPTRSPSRHSSPGGSAFSTSRRPWRRCWTGWAAPPAEALDAVRDLDASAPSTRSGSPPPAPPDGSGNDAMLTSPCRQVRTFDRLRGRARGAGVRARTRPLPRRPLARRACGGVLDRLRPGVRELDRPRRHESGSSPGCRSAAT